jgi:bidirectional [NiFe] hydrogenase diaphorase subunit
MAKVWINGQTEVEMVDYPGMKAIHLTIDGKRVRALPGESILEVVRGRPGIGNVPALCYHPAIKPYGACRLCTVEIGEGPDSRFVAACLYPVSDGLAVRTNTEKVRMLRKGILELLLARCPGVKKIQDLAQEYGVEKPRYALGDQECILCGLCVRACQEIIGRSAISLVNRGIYREVAAPFYAYELGEACIGCGDCVHVCPTGAIQLGPDGKPVLPKVKIAYPEVEALIREAELTASRR